MRSSEIRRHLSVLRELLATVNESSPAMTFRVVAGAPPQAYEGELSPRDYISFLLHIDAEIEHGLMVQYLYAAYSLGGPQIPPQHRDLVRGWQEIILGIAKEEMGHLVTVQNVLRLIGSPLNIGREDYPWDVPFYPFPFMLEPLTRASLARYIYAESPKDWQGPLADEICAQVEKVTSAPHRVSELFALMISLLQDVQFLPDSAFLADTYPFQSNWAEWGRGYRSGQRGNSAHANPPTSPDVLIIPTASRDDAVNALKRIAEQGEAPESEQSSEPSHFTRFLTIYEQMKSYEGEGWLPVKPVATNPYVSLDAGVDPAEGLAANIITNLITYRESRLWAQLHNVRYRMLLTYLGHSFALNGGLTTDTANSRRGAIINATFGEMYNLRAIADLLMQLPLKEHDVSGLNAGPPFQMPYTLEIPPDEANRWRLHLDLLFSSDRLSESLLGVVPTERRNYLISMREADQQMRVIITQILNSYINFALI